MDRRVKPTRHLHLVMRKPQLVTSYQTMRVSDKRWSRRSCGFQPNRHGNDAPMGEDGGIRPSANHADAGCLGTWDKATVCLCTLTTLSHCTAASRGLPARQRTYACSWCMPYSTVLETCISSYPMSISRPARSPRPATTLCQLVSTIITMGYYYHQAKRS